MTEPRTAGESGQGGSGWRSPRALLRGNVLWLSLVSLLNDASSEMIYPLLPAFVLQVLGAGPAFLGLIEGVADATSSLVKLGGGWLSDRLHRRKALAVWGYGIAAVLRPFMAVAAQAWHVLVIRFADRVGKGIRTAPRDALLAGSVAAQVRGTAFGIHRAADHAGAVIGPLLATGILLLAGGEGGGTPAAGPLRLAFAISAIPALIGVAVLILRVRERGVDGPDGGMDVPAGVTPASATREAKPAAAHLSVGVLRRLGGPFHRFMAVLVLFTLGNATDAFLLLRAQQLGVALALIPILWAVFHVSKMSWSIPGGMLADRLGPRPAIAVGWLVYAVAYAGFAVAAMQWQIWALFLFYGLFYGLTEAPEKALVARYAPAADRGFAFGAYHSSIGIAALPASVLFGLLWQRFGPETAFLVGGGLALAASVLLVVLVPEQPATPA